MAAERLLFRKPSQRMGEKTVGLVLLVIVLGGLLAEEVNNTNGSRQHPAVGQLRERASH